MLYRVADLILRIPDLGDMPDRLSRYETSAKETVETAKEGMAEMQTLVSIM